jgi:hypothetical protein
MKLAFQPNLKMEVIRMSKFIALLISISIAMMVVMGPKRAILWMAQKAVQAHIQGPMSYSEYTRQLTGQ